MSGNYEKDMALSLSEALLIINSVKDEKVEVSKTHEKTNEFRSNHSQIKNDLVNLIRSIDENDYISGPIPDDKPNENRNKPVWIFKKEWEGLKLYIKIKIFITIRKVYVLSLHEDERK